MSNFQNIYSDDDLPDYDAEQREQRLTIRTSANEQHRAEAACDSANLIRILLNSARLGFHVPKKGKP